MKKEKCDCGRIAVWPGYSSRCSPFFCDDCVHRGCDCNRRYVDVNAYSPPLDHPEWPDESDMPVKWIENGKVWCSVDDKGREYPCEEYSYDKDGFDVDRNNIKK